MKGKRKATDGRLAIVVAIPRESGHSGLCCEAECMALASYRTRIERGPEVLVDEKRCERHTRAWSKKHAAQTAPGTSL